jgi:hypothetical protein
VLLFRAKQRPRARQAAASDHQDRAAGRRRALDEESTKERPVSLFADLFTCLDSADNLRHWLRGPRMLELRRADRRHHDHDTLRACAEAGTSGSAVRNAIGVRSARWATGASWRPLSGLGRRKRDVTGRAGICESSLLPGLSRLLAEGEGFEPSMDEKTPITVFETAVSQIKSLQIPPLGARARQSARQFARLVLKDGRWRAESSVA